MTIPVGTTVLATNRGAVTHTWTSRSGAWDSSDLQPGKAYAHRFTTPGVFAFVCSIHASMTGTITVH